MGFEVPTSVQAESIPVILSGRHVYPSVYLFDLSSLFYIPTYLFYFFEYFERLYTSLMQIPDLLMLLLELEKPLHIWLLLFIICISMILELSVQLELLVSLFIRSK